MSLMMSFAVSPIFYGAALACGQSFEYETFVVASTSDDIMINSKRPMICFSVNSCQASGTKDSSSRFFEVGLYVHSGPN
ncbi:hypothetical protein CPB85DRAFT_1325068 [Mucidula mucida]|nr:hypothetical protein CPB85DRAFT_1325068 [Mucidula mucida]